MIMFVVIIMVLFLVIKLRLAATFPLEAIYWHSYFALMRPLQNIYAMNNLPF